MGVAPDQQLAAAGADRARLRRVVVARTAPACAVGSRARDHCGVPGGDHRAHAGSGGETRRRTWTRRPTAGMIFHADRGCQYASPQMAVVADELDVMQGPTLVCWDNA